MTPRSRPTPTGPHPPLRSDRHPDAPDVITHCLATTHPSPQQAYTEWTEQGVTLIPLGHRFNAIRIPGNLIHAATHTCTPDQAALMLRDTLDGPLIHDHLSTGPTYYALIPQGPDIVWLGANDTPLLGPGTHLGIPAFRRTTPPGTFWITPPHHRNHLCNPDTVHTLINTGRRNLCTTTTGNTNTSPSQQH